MKRNARKLLSAAMAVVLLSMLTLVPAFAEDVEENGEPLMITAFGAAPEGAEEGAPTYIDEDGNEQPVPTNGDVGEDLETADLAVDAVEETDEPESDDVAKPVSDISNIIGIVVAVIIAAAAVVAVILLAPKKSGSKKN